MGGCGVKTAKLTKRTMKLIEVPLAGLLLSGSWKKPDPETQHKLVASVAEYGQLRPLVVGCTPSGERLLVKGRRLAEAMMTAGCDTGSAVDLGELTEAEVGMARLALQIRFRTDYAVVASFLASMLALGANKNEMAATGPYTAERITHMDTLTRFDWNQFAEASDGQSAMSWDDEVPAGPELAPQVVAPVAVAPAVPDLPMEVEPQAAPPTAPVHPAADIELVPFAAASQKQGSLWGGVDDLG